MGNFPILFPVLCINRLYKFSETRKGVWLVVVDHVIVKNGVSDLTKEQTGQDQCRKEVMNDCWEKALKEGCHEREQAWRGVSSTEKTNTKEDLARVMTISKSMMQTVTNGCVSQKGNESSCGRAFQHQRLHRVSKIEA